MLKPEDVRQLIVSLCRRLLGNGFTLDPFYYRINFDSVAASATATGQFLVQQDSAFALTHMMYTATATDNTAVANLQPYGSGGASSLTTFLVTLTDSGSGRNLMDGAVPLDTIFGTAIRPYYLAHPKILDPASQFTATVQNLDTVNARRLRLVFGGYKIFGNIEAFKKTI